MEIRRYSAPLTVLAAGVLGFSLICIVSAAALTSPITPNTSDIQAQDIVDSAFSNPINTAVAMTVVEITAYIPSPTPSLVDATLSALTTPFGTATPRSFITWTPLPPTRTRDGVIPATATRIPPSQTATRIPPTPTRIIPSFTPTDIPDTNTPRPPTDTPVPPPTDTDTPVPPPTDTDTPVPPPTDTDTPVPPPIDTDTPVPPTDTPVS